MQSHLETLKLCSLSEIYISTSSTRISHSTSRASELTGKSVYSSNLFTISITCSINIELFSPFFRFDSLIKSLICYHFCNVGEDERLISIENFDGKYRTGASYGFYRFYLGYPLRHFTQSSDVIHFNPNFHSTLPQGDNSSQKWN